MFRITLTQIGFFLLPFAVYALWLWLSKKTETAKAWSRGHIFWLTVAGGLLVIVSFVVMVSFKEGHEGQTYRPVEFRDGVLVPGRYE